MTSREEILRRVRDALKNLPDDERPVTVPRAYRQQAPGISPEARAAIVDLFVERLNHYGAHVHQVTTEAIAGTVSCALRAHAAKSVVAPNGLPLEWLASWVDDEHHIVRDHPHLSAADLDNIDAVVTTCAGAIADSGTVVLDGGPGQGRRAPTLVPNCHVCVVRAEQVESSLPEMLDRLDPRHPITWFSGPSATVDFERIRVQGVHGPRTLIVILVE